MATPALARGKLALVVDDQSDFCIAMEHLLATFGFQVACAADGVEALGQLKKLSPDLILLDLFMPRMDGIDLLRKLRAGGKPIPPVLAVTGKPFNREQLGEAVSYVLNADKGSPAIM